MPEMKDSGVRWIGEIPIDWSVCRFKDIAHLYTGNSIKDNEKEKYEDACDAKPYIATKDINKMFSTIDYENGIFVKQNDLSFKVAPCGSTLMCIEGGSAGVKKAKLNQEVSFVNKLCCINGFGINNDFLYYFLQSPSYEDEFKRNISGLIGGVSVEKLKIFNIIIPPLVIQKNIANFLDQKCTEIDSLYSDIEKQIEVLEEYKKSVITEAVTKGLNSDVKMKDSGIKWIGRIPITWNRSKIKYAIFPQEKAVYPSDEIITCFRDGEVTLRKNRREDGYTISLTEHGYHGVDIGDLVIHGMDAFAGAIGCSDSRGKTTPVVHVCNTIGNNRYFMYFLRCMAYGDILMDLSDGVRIRSSDYRNFSKLGVFGIVIPPISEQNEIVDFLDRICNEIDVTLIEKKAQLETLAEYKKCLIYEYVTGKKEVPADV